MSYVKTNWVNGTTPINADNLNNIEDGIENNETNINDMNNILVSTNTTSTGIITTTTPQTIYSTTLNKGTYLNINNILINLYGQSGRDMIVAIYVNNVEKTRVNAVINTNAYTFPVSVNYSFEVTADSTPFRIDVWSSIADKSYIVNSSLVQILKLK